MWIGANFFGAASGNGPFVLALECMLSVVKSDGTNIGGWGELNPLPRLTALLECRDSKGGGDGAALSASVPQQAEGRINFCTVWLRRVCNISARSRIENGRE